MKPWELRTPHILLREEKNLSDEVRAEWVKRMEAIPGVRCGFNGEWVVPVDALEAVEAVRGGVPVRVRWGIEVPKIPSWPEVEVKLRAGGELRHEFLGDWPKPYQKDAICWAWNRQGAHFWHATGSGKSFSGLAAALATPGTILIITKAAVRRQYAREIERFTNLRAHVVLPKGLMSPRVAVEGVTWRSFYRMKKQAGLKRDEIRAAWKALKETKGVDTLETLPQYLARVRASGKRPVVVAAWETMRERLDELIEVRASTVIFDEMHVGRNHKRWEQVALRELPEDPKERYAREVEEYRDAKKQNGFIKDTPEGRKLFIPYESVASAAARLSRSAKRAIGTTATPIANRLSDLWGQLDTVEPNAHGSAHLWHTRYCDKKPGAYGGFDIRGESNRSELDRRLHQIAHVVPKSLAAQFMPKVRRISMYLGPEELTRPGAGFAKELKDAGKRGPTAVLEVKLAMAAAMKRPALLSLVEEHLTSGAKIAVLTARRKACDAFAEEVRKLMKGRSGVGAWAAHGEQSTDVRQGIVDEFMKHPGPCIFVGTGDAFGTGVNLDDADVVLFELLPYTVEKILQWEGRFQRNSSTKSVQMIYPIAEGTVDEHIASTLLDKLPTAQQLSKDDDIIATQNALSGFDSSETEEQFASRILDFLDED